MDGSSNTMKTEISKFESDAFMEYKRRVFQQLAEEYDKEKQQQQQHNPIIGASHMTPDTDNLHASNYYQSDTVMNADELQRGTSDPQPSWDDSDLQTEIHVLPSSNNFANSTLPLPKHHGSKVTCHDSILLPEKLSKSDNDLKSSETQQPLMDWPSFDKQIELKSTKAKSDDSFDSIDVMSPLTSKPQRGKKTSQKDQTNIDHPSSPIGRKQTHFIHQYTWRQVVSPRDNPAASFPCGEEVEASCLASSLLRQNVLILIRDDFVELRNSEALVLVRSSGSTFVALYKLCCPNEDSV